MDAADRPRRCRRATRIVVVHRGRTLLFHDTDPGLPGSSWWTTPGGGVDAGESWLDAGVRELREETGFDLPASAFAGPIAERIVVHGYSDRITEQHEVFYRVELPDALAASAISTDDHTESERERIVGHAWLSPADLEGLTVWPAHLPDLMTADPATCRDLGRVEESTLPAP